MKKMIFFVLLVAIAVPAAWSQEVPQLGVGIISSELTGPGSLTLYSNSSRDTTDKVVGVGFNLLIPGLGCFIIGDTTGGLWSLLGVGLSAVSLGLTTSAYVLTGDWEYLAYSITSGLLLLFFEVYNIVRPIVYVNNR
jgi:hypothetical protein